MSAGEAVRGDREIVPEEAEIVRRIFREFAAGKSPKAIAVDLNRDGSSRPARTCLGRHQHSGPPVSRGTGIINNELYAGVLVWNRLRFVKDPSTGQRVSRINPESAWIRTEVPHLRIVDDALWQATRARQRADSRLFGPTPTITSGRPDEAGASGQPSGLPSFRPPHLRVLRWPVGLIMRDRFGCLNHHRRGTCDNNRTTPREKIEQRVLAGLKDKLISADSVAEAVRAYAQETNRLNRDRRAQSRGRPAGAGQDRPRCRRYSRRYRGRHVSAGHEGAHGGTGTAEGGDRGALGAGSRRCARRASQRRQHLPQPR